jgi:hypothetical protein
MEIVNTSTTTDPVNMYNYLNNFFMNPTIFIIIILIIILFYIFSSNLGTDYQDESIVGSDNSSSVVIILCSILVIFILVNVFEYFFSINVKAYIQGLFTPNPKLEIVVDENTSNLDENIKIGSGRYTGVTDHDSQQYNKLSHNKSSHNKSQTSELKLKKQVFNIPGNYYTYDNAKALCSAYGAKLATYNQIEQAYNNGADWCNYGWSENQLALFPTQQKTYDILQSKPGHENDCGRQGINGGYIANPNVRFGVNCYGHKPKMRGNDVELMNKLTPYPETQQDVEFQQKVDHMKKKLNNIPISPFNDETWDEI